MQTEDSVPTPAAVLYQRLWPLMVLQDRRGSLGCPTTPPLIPECQRTRRAHQETGVSGSWILPRCCSLGAPEERATSLGDSIPPFVPAWAPLMPSTVHAEWDHLQEQETPLALPVGSEGHRQAGQRRRCSALHRHLVSYWGSGGWQPDRLSPEDPKHSGAERMCWERSEFPHCSEEWEKFSRWSWSVGKCRPWSGRMVQRWTRCWMDRCCLQNQKQTSPQHQHERG